jgi:pyruvate dehydrogenase E2 component (dihydrolipoamide acetyltransferase)
MPTEVIMPALGMAQETGKLVRWLKADGEEVKKREPLMEVETDKITVEIEAPADGRLAGVAAAEGDDVPVGRVIAYVLAAGEDLPAVPGTAIASLIAAQVSAAVAGDGPTEASEPSGSTGTDIATNGQGADAGTSLRRVLASPLARRLARERGLRVEEIAGSGPYGAVVAADVEAAGGAPHPGHKVGAAVGVSSAWQTMARRMGEAWQSVPHFYLVREVEATRLNGWRDAIRSRPGLERVTHTDLLAKICAAALLDHPRLRRSWQNGTLVESDPIDIGIAVATDDTLVVPIIRNVDRLSLGGIAERREDIVARARERKLHHDDLEGGTFTISNLGMFGVDAFNAIVNMPQSAILAVGRIADRTVPVDGVPAVRPMCVMTLSLDHRAVDGAIGARFLETLTSLVEEPAGLLT